MSEPIDNLQFCLEKLGANEAEAELICARLTGLLAKAASSDPAQAAMWLEAYAAGLYEVAETIRGQPRTRDIEIASAEPRGGRYLMLREYAELADTCDRDEVLVLGPGVIRVLMGMSRCHYPFQAEDVTLIHRYKGGFQGFWYRLQDGRVFDKHGRPSEPADPAYYTARLH